MKRLSALLVALLVLCSACAAAAEGANAAQMIPFRFASKAEGRALLLSNEKYYAGFTPNKLAYLMQDKNATMEEYLAMAGEQVEEWTDAETEMIAGYMRDISDRFARNGWTMPPLDTVVFVKTTMAEENFVSGYTHGARIYLSSTFETFASMPEQRRPGDAIAVLLAHELFHCLTRRNPDFRRAMYGIIHFTIAERDFELPPSVLEYYIANPDVERHDAYATFRIDGRDIDCFTAFVTKKHFERPGDSFIADRETALVPIDGTDAWYPKDRASNFYDIFGRNTDYVLDPEECLAANFANAVWYGMDGKGGKGYPNPEIIRAICDVLSEY